MAISFKKTLKILAVFFVVIAVALSAPAKSKKKKKNKNNGLPKVEVCRINKKGKEICKMRVLKGKRAIIWLYEELMATNARIAENTELIDLLNEATQDLQTSLIDLELRVTNNEGSIAENQQAIQAILADYQELKLAVDSQLADFDALTSQFTALELQVEGNNTQLTTLGSLLVQYRNELTAKTNALFSTQSKLQRDLFELNQEFERQKVVTQQQILNLQNLIQQVRDDIPSDADITTLVLSNSQITGMLSDIQMLTSGLNDAEAVIDELLAEASAVQDEIANIQTDIGAIGTRLALVEHFVDFLEEYYFVDTPGDDATPTSLKEFFENSKADENWFIFVEVKSSVDSTIGAWCAENAKWYKDRYLEFGQRGYTESGTWNKWYRTTPEGAWTGSNQPYLNYWGLDCDAQPWAWCSEWGIGRVFLGILPSRTGEDETFSDGRNRGDGYALVKVAKNRINACGF